jgi:hypothetical protein
MIKDAIDINAVQFYSPVPVAGFASTVDLIGAEFHPADDKGIKPLFDRRALAGWPDFTLPGWDGPLQWTIFMGFQINGRWHMGAMLEFWSDRLGSPREWTGAHPAVVSEGLTHWQRHLAYAKDRYGALSNVAPYEGIPMALMMVAGGARPGTSNHPTVPERSNIIVVPLKMSGTETVSNEPGPPATEPAIPAPQPEQPANGSANPPVPDSGFQTLESLLVRIAEASEANAAFQQDTLKALRALLEELS